MGRLTFASPQIQIGRCLGGKCASLFVLVLCPKGAGVVTTRAHVHYVVTEYGIAQLFGKNLRQRAAELIRIAAPEHRQMLEKASFDRFKVMPSLD